MQGWGRTIIDAGKSFTTDKDIVTREATQDHANPRDMD